MHVLLKLTGREVLGLGLALLASGSLSLTLPLSASAAGGNSPLPPPPLPGASGDSSANGAPATLPDVDKADKAPPVEVKVAPGPAEAGRRALLSRINQAKNQGIGTSTYMMAFDALEQSAKSGESDESINKRVASLNSSLDDQFKRSANLKTQRPIGPSVSYESSSGGASSSSSGSAPAPGSLPPGMGGGNTDTAALIQKLRAKYGDQIPDSLRDKIPAGMGNDPSALLKNPQVQDLLKTLKTK